MTKHPVPTPKQAPPPFHRSRTGWLLAALLTAALAIRILYAMEVVQRPEYRQLTFDAFYHDYWAKAWVTGNWTPPDPQADPEIGSHPYFRPPGYPFFLAAVYAVSFCSTWAPMVAQMALGLFSVLLAFLLGRRWFSPSLGLLWAAGMVATWSFPYFEGELLEPSLLVFLGLLLVASLACWTENKYVVPGLIAGLIFGAYSLVRPNALLLGPLILAWGFWVAKTHHSCRPFWKGALAFTMASALLILPSTLRNHRISGEWVLVSANGGVNLYCGNNPYADGYSPAAPEIVGWDCFDYPRLLRTLPSKPGMAYTAASKEFARRAWTYAREHPARTVELLIQKTLLFWGPLEVGNNKDDELERADSAVLRKIPLTFAFAHAGFWLGLGVILWTRRTGQREKHLAGLLAVLALGLFATYLPFIVAGRYRIPILPFLLFFTARGLQHLWELAREHKWKPLGAWSATGIALLFATHQNWAGYSPDRIGFLYGRGRAFDLNGQPEIATVFFREATAQDPQFAQKLTQMAQILVDRGRSREALLRLRHARMGNPRYKKADELTAAILEQTSSTPEAKAASLDPTVLP